MDGGRQGGKRQVGAARRRSRGHGLARLDGTRPRATVADKVMESGKTAGHGNGRPDVPTARQAKRAGPDQASRAGGVSRAKRGDDGSPTGARRRRRLDAPARQRDGGTPGRPGFQALQRTIRQTLSSEFPRHCLGNCRRSHLPAKPRNVVSVIREFGPAVARSSTPMHAHAGFLREASLGQFLHVDTATHQGGHAWRPP